MTRRAFSIFAALALTACTDDAGGGENGGTGTGTGTGATAGPGTGETGETAGGTDTATEGEDTSSSGPVDCTIPSHADDIALRLGDESVLPGTAHRLVESGGGVLACGDGFFAQVDSLGATARVLEDPAFAGTCTGLSAAGQDHALVAMSDGRASLVSLGGAPEIASTVADVAPRLHDVVGTATDAWVAAGSDGVLRLPIAIDLAQLGVAEATPGAQDARGLALVDGALLVADGFALGDIDDPTVGGAAVRLIDSAGGGLLAEVTAGPGIASRPFVVDGRAVVLRPGVGFDVFNVSADALDLLYSTSVGEVIVDAAFDGDVMLAAAGSRLLRFTLGETEATPVSSEDRPERGNVSAPWFRAIAHAGGDFVVGLGESLSPVDLGPGEPTPQIALEAYTLTMSAGQTEALFSFDNLGHTPLVVTGVEVDAPFSAEIAADLNPEKAGCPGQFEVDPGARLLFYVRVEGTGEHTERSVRLLSNDPDQPSYEGVVEIERPVAAPGDSAEDFHLLAIDGTDVDFSNYAGKVLLAKLYNPL